MAAPGTAGGPAKGKRNMLLRGLAWVEKAVKARCSAPKMIDLVPALHVFLPLACGLDDGFQLAHRILSTVSRCTRLRAGERGGAFACCGRAGFSSEGKVALTEGVTTHSRRG